MWLRSEAVCSPKLLPVFPPRLPLCRSTGLTQGIAPPCKPHPRGTQELRGRGTKFRNGKGKLQRSRGGPTGQVIVAPMASGHPSEIVTWEFPSCADGRKGGIGNRGPELGCILQPGHLEQTAALHADDAMLGPSFLAAPRRLPRHLDRLQKLISFATGLPVPVQLSGSFLFSV